MVFVQLMRPCSYLFSIICVCFYNNEDRHRALRADTIRNMNEHADDFKDIRSRDPDENLPLNKYRAKIRLRLL